MNVSKEEKAIANGDVNELEIIYKVNPETAGCSCSTEAPCYVKWFDASKEKPEEDLKVLAVTQENKLFCARFQRVKRSICDDAPYDDKWYASPGWGHELKIVFWAYLPFLPESCYT